MGLLDDTAAADAREAKAGAKGDAQTREAQATAAKNEAVLPTVGPSARVGLASDTAKLQFTPLEQSRAEYKEFKGNKAVDKYEISLPYLALALQTKANKTDDSELVMLAAKLQDPEGSVREGDAARFTHAEAAIDYIPQQFKREFISGEGQFTDKGRADIRAFLRRRLEQYRTGYLNERQSVMDRIERSNKRGPVQIDPLDAVGADPWDKFKPVLDDYDKQMKTAKEIEAHRKKEGGRTAPDEGPPKGTVIAGEPVKGWRLSPEGEARAFNYLRDTGDAKGYAAMIADTAVEEGKIQPEERDGIVASTGPAAQTYIEKYGKTPEDRKKMVPGLNYSQIDEEAQKNLSLPGAALHAITNIPSSAGQAVTAAGGMALDAGESLRQGKPVGDIKAMTDVGGDLLSGGGPSSAAALEGLKKRYGGYSELKNTLATDPVGLGLDVAGGAGLAMKVPTIARAVGRGAGAVGSMIPQGLRDFASTAAGAAVDAPGQIIRGAGGLLTGVPGEATRNVGGVGRRRGLAGVTSPEYEGVVGDLRGRGDPTEVIDAARNAVAQMRRDASAQYRSGMVDVSRDRTTLDFAPIDQRLADLHSSAYHHGTVKNPRAAQVWQEAHDIVEEWRNADPATHHTPEGFDAMKQRLGDLVETYTTSGDRASARIARGVYQGVRQEIANQVPTYAQTMRDYERAADLTRELERTFSLGDQAAVDTTMRKLQSVTRNNANTNYGYRTRLAELMEQYSPGILDRLSAQSLSSSRPRGLQAAVAGGLTGVGLPTAALGGLGITGGGAGPGLALLAAAPLTIPRVSGEIALGAGRMAGEAERLGRRALNSPVGRGLTYLPRNYPVGSIGATQLASRLEEGAGPPDQGEPGLAPVLSPDDEDIHVNRRVVPPGMAYGGAVRDLSHRYNCGGPVHYASGGPVRDIERRR